MNKRGKILSISGVVAAVAITAAYFYYPPATSFTPRVRSASFRSTRSSRSARTTSFSGMNRPGRSDAALYGDLLKDAVKLESYSAELASFARNLGSAELRRSGPGEVHSDARQPV
jgi:hypothetical protein